uniref:Coiled-coil domain-containing protein 86 n=1 Tax=Ditylenchus dipsaci TaxID=166011 RepID=A0A915EVM5_9BILA
MEPAEQSEVMEVDKQTLSTAFDATSKRGLPKSGRWWKNEHKKRHTDIIRVKPLKSSWAVKMQQKNTGKMVKAKQTEIREALAEEKIRIKEERKEREERRKANEKKGEVVQVIRNTAKLKNTKKKNLRKVEMRDMNKK